MSEEVSYLLFSAYNLQESILRNLRKLIWQVIAGEVSVFFISFCFSEKTSLRTRMYYQGKPKCFRLTTVSTHLRVSCCFAFSILLWAESHVSSQRSQGLRDRTRLKYLQTLPIHCFNKNVRYSPSLLNFITFSSVQMIKTDDLFYPSQMLCE